jgi:pimeloyl-ACP methyl ester carboxylesterase
VKAFSERILENKMIPGMPAVLGRVVPAVRDFSLRCRFGLPRNSKAVQDWRRASEDLASLAPWGEVSRPIVFIEGYCDIPERWTFFRECISRKCTNLSRPPIRGPGGLRDISISELAQETALSLRRQGIDAVDVVAHSMGGLVAYVMACTCQTSLVKVRRLFTLATPFSGARVATLGRAVGMPFPTQLREMEYHSDFVKGVLRCTPPADLRVSTYHIQGDLTVSAESSHSIRGQHHEYEGAFWMLPDMTHVQMPQDPRVVSAVLREILTGDADHGTGTDG